MYVLHTCVVYAKAIKQSVLCLYALMLHECSSPSLCSAVIAAALTVCFTMMIEIVALIHTVLNVKEKRKKNLRRINMSVTLDQLTRRTSSPSWPP
jgi:hypothetical protein